MFVLVVEHLSDPHFRQRAVCCGANSLKSALQSIDIVDFVANLLLRISICCCEMIERVTGIKGRGGLSWRNGRWRKRGVLA